MSPHVFRPAFALVLLLFAPPLLAQNPKGRLTGTVPAQQADAPLPYAVVSISDLVIERFTDASGRFAISGISPGTHKVLIRRIGFAPWRGNVTVVADGATVLDVRLDQLPQRLAAVAIVALSRCRNPGPPDPVLQTETSSLVSQLRENADRYRLLAEQYPFAYSQLRALGDLRESTFAVQRVDTSLVLSSARVAYRPGSLVIRTTTKDRGDEFSMAIPTLLELTRCLRLKRGGESLR